ncbi:kinesin-like protein KIN-1 [Glycine max]|uniref:kinesin-like protein KIN-1 n=1 Tax=Glycine max TaxID=3847 RepID=UPI000E21BE81|nr:kinesin-like protein KIN-1 [Glycine max]|eukprot:XP_025981838.1 kinesin-like protein KIN-1 isoform X1 [Glycine max]
MFPRHPSTKFPTSIRAERRSWGMVREHLVFQQKSLTKGKRIWCRRRLREENLVQTQVPRILECEEQNKGLLPRVVEGLFDSINSLDIEKTYSVKLSMVEIYMEKVRDLFDLSKDNIQIKEIKSRGIILPGVTEVSSILSQCIPVILFMKWLYF